MAVQQVGSVLGEKRIGRVEFPAFTFAPYAGEVSNV